MATPESMPGKEHDPKLQPVLEQYGHVLVLNHENQPQPLRQAVDDCPPFVTALLNAENPEQLEQIIDALKAPE